MSESSASPSGPIVARGGRYYRNARFILAALLLAYGVWSVHDGFYTWPAQRDEAIAHHEKPPHGDMSILFNQAMAVATPMIGALLVAWVLWNSRGEYRLENDVLHVPGHPPVPLGAIEQVDKSKWERKGVARVGYTAANGKITNLSLDDFVYDQIPTDAIFARIEKHLLGELESEEQAPSRNPI